MDIGQELDSNVAFRYLWYVWRILGISPTKNLKYVYYLYSVFIHLAFMICSALSAFIKWFFMDVKELFDSLSVSMSVIVVNWKHFGIGLHVDQLKSVHLYLGPLDKRSNAHPEDRLHVLKAIRTCHRMNIMYFVVLFVAATALVVNANTNHTYLYAGWFPTLFEDGEMNYKFFSIYQTCAIYTVMFQNCNNDSYPLCYIAMMIGHLRALRSRVARIGKNDTASIEENTKELLACIQDHKLIIGYFDLIRPIISRTMFAQFVLSAFIICFSAFNLVQMDADSDISAMLFQFLYFGVIVYEVFPCCWFVTSLMRETDAFTTALYSCNWYDQDQKFRRMLVIFMQRSQLTCVVLAGNLLPLTLQNFLAVIRFSFSMLTLLLNTRVR